MLEWGDPLGFFSACADHHTKWNKSSSQREVSGARSIITETGTPLLEMWVQKGRRGGGLERVRKKVMEVNCVDVWDVMVKPAFLYKEHLLRKMRANCCKNDPAVPIPKKKNVLNINWGARVDQGQSDVFRRSGPLSMWTKVSTTCRTLHKDFVLRLVLKRP